MVRFCCMGILAGTLVLTAAAQDTQFAPRGQQIPAPDCLNLHFAWENEQPLCPPGVHERWLKDIEHWREERLIRIAYDGSRYDMPALKWNSLHSAIRIFSFRLPHAASIIV